jgi:hypothetical protein
MDQKPFSTIAGDGFQPDPPDQKLLQLLAHLPVAKRVRVMLEARELAVGLIRGRLRRRYPDLSVDALNLKVLEEIDRGEKRTTKKAAQSQSSQG